MAIWHYQSFFWSWSPVVLYLVCLILWLKIYQILQIWNHLLEQELMTTKVNDHVLSIGCDVGSENLLISCGVSLNKKSSHQSPHLVNVSFKSILICLTSTIFWINSSQSEITDAPVLFYFLVLFLMYFLNFLYFLNFSYFVIWLDSPYELPCQICSL